MLARLEQLVKDVADLNTKLILIVGTQSRSGKSRLLRQLAEKLGCNPINLGLSLGRRLANTPHHQRAITTSDLLREVVNEPPGKTPLLLDNLELLFEPSLRVNPLDLIKRLAHARCVVAVWPGTLCDERLLYADINHPEHHEYSTHGTAIFQI